VQIFALAELHATVDFEHLASAIGFADYESG
jgi:hypothetical protein